MAIAREQADVVVVGARCAGSAAAIALARAGRRVIALDRASFPSDTLSTHVLFPSGVAELARVGALERVRASGPPPCPWIVMYAAGEPVRERYTPVDGIDHALCVPRTILDLALVQTAREAGAEVREGTSVEALVRDAGGRVTGVRCRARDGAATEIAARLVIGADGRRSTVAALVGADPPYRGSRNGRGLAFFYMDDPKVGTPWRETMAQWRVGDTLGMTFPCPDDRMVLLFMGPAGEIARFRRDPDGVLAEQLRANRRLAERIDGATNRSKLRSTGDTAAYFRASTGPGWALAGDAGHFKDPVIAQGIRDAVRFARLLGEAVAPALEDPGALDRALRAWEADRDRECLPAYHWGNRDSRAVPPSALFAEVARDFGRTTEPDFSDAFARVRHPEHVVGPLRSARALGRALRRPGVDRGALLREAAGELAIDVDIRRERLAGRFRAARPAASERPGWTWPPAPPARPARPAAEAAAPPAGVGAA